MEIVPIIWTIAALLIVLLAVMLNRSNSIWNQVLAFLAIFMSLQLGSYASALPFYKDGGNGVLLADADQWITLAIIVDGCILACLGIIRLIRGHRQFADEKSLDG